MRTAVVRTRFERERQRDVDLRVDVLRAVARPPRAPAVRTDIVPRPELRDELFELRDVELDAVARPPFAPAFFFCAVVPARPPFAPAAFTVIVLRVAVLRVAVLRAVVFFVAVFFFDAAVVFFRAEDEDDEADVDFDVDLDFVSPDSARCLLTVRAAISFARFVERPCLLSESLMCSYCRSRFELHDSGMGLRPPGVFLGGRHMPASSGRYSQ